jgi:hypothetical protein
MKPKASSKKDLKALGFAAPALFVLCLAVNL